MDEASSGICSPGKIVCGKCDPQVVIAPFAWRLAAVDNKCKRMEMCFKSVSCAAEIPVSIESTVLALAACADWPVL